MFTPLKSTIDFVVSTEVIVAVALGVEVAIVPVWMLFIGLDEPDWLRLMLIQSP